MQVTVKHGEMIHLQFAWNDITLVIDSDGPRVKGSIFGDKPPLFPCRIRSWQVEVIPFTVPEQEPCIMCGN